MPSFPFPQLLFLQFDSLAFWLHRCQLFSYKTEAHAAEDPKRHELIEPKRTPGQPVTAGLSDLFMRTLFLQTNLTLQGWLLEHESRLACITVGALKYNLNISVPQKSVVLRY
ncbi:Ornithine Carbamoyltransferase [Manis pentadactyla]|nr:Ornithine Carbamoyltransferase [Manis pentadactyla]